MSVGEEDIINATGIFNTPLEFWGSPTPPDIMRTDFPPTETTPTRGIRTFLNGQSIQFKSMINALP